MPVHRRKRTDPQVIFLTLALLLGGGIALALWLRLRLHPLLCYLIGVNAATFCAYAYDKAGAPRQWLRVPERVLHGLALVGGTPAALLAQMALRHKTLKRSFRVRFLLIVVIQLSLIGAWVWYRR